MTELTRSPHSPAPGEAPTFALAESSEAATLPIDGTAARASSEPSEPVAASSSGAMPTSCASGFEALGLPEPILRAVRELGYLTPTPIQARAIPVVLEGRDVMGRAQTGTGKTAAFALPILARLAKYANSSPSPARHPVRALILAPTRELAIQIGQNVAAYGKYTGLRSTVVYGGVDIREQEKAVRAGVEVLVATPGRLLDHHEQRNVFLNYLEVLVLDEADRMLDMGFLPDIHRILALLPRERQSLLFSATFPEEIRELADRMLRSPAVIEVARRSTAAETVTQRLYRVAAEDKRRLLAHLVRSENLTQVLVFCRSKAETARLARALAREGFSTTELHGDKTQEERLKALEAFKSGAATIMVATDVAARGLDIEELPVVVNYELPFVAEDYVHRIGRTGRAGASGVAISFVSPEEERLLEEIERLIKRTIKVVPLPDLAQRPERGNVATRAGASEAKDRPRDPKHFANNPDQPPARPVPIGARTRRPSEICALLRPPAHTSPAPSPRAPALERVEHDHLQDVSA